MSAVNLNRKCEAIKIKLAQILQKSSSNPKFHGVTFVDVKMSPDSTSALVLYSVFSSSYKHEDITNALNEASGFFQAKLAKTLKSRNTPKLHFVYDKGFDHALKIDELLNNIH